MKTGASVCLFWLLVITAGSIRPARGTPSPTMIDAWDSPHSVAVRRAAYGHFQRGEYVKAGHTYRAAYHEALSRRDYRSTARFLNNFCGTQFALLRYTDALQTCLEGRDFAERVNDSITIAAVSHHLASLYAQMNDLNLAIAAADRGLTAVSSGKERLPLLVLMIWLRASRGEMPAALEAFSESVRLADEAGSLSMQAHAWDHLGFSYLQAGNLGAADEALSQAYRLRLMSGDKTISSSYLKLGILRYKQGDYAGGLVMLNRAEASLSAGPILEPIWNLYWQRGQVKRAQGRLTEALADFRIALDFARRWRLEVAPAAELRANAAVRLHELYSSFIDAAGEVYLTTGSTALARDAFEAAEQNREAAWRKDSARGAHRGLSDEYLELLARLRSLEASLLQHDSESTRASLRDVRLALAEMEARSSVRANESSGNPKRQAADRSETWFAFHLGEPRSWRWEITNSGLTMQPLAGRAVLESHAKQLREAVQQRNDHASEIGRTLYQDLFSNLSPSSESSARWTLVLDRGLYEAPIPALVVDLHGSDPVYLIERRSLRLAPSTAPSESRTAHAAPKSRGTFLGVGDAVYNSADPRWTGRSSWLSSFFTKLHILRSISGNQSQFHLARLPGSGHELTACANQWSDGTALLLTGTDASLARLRVALGLHPSVLHLATHMVPSASGTEEALIALGLQASGEPELLTAADISALRTNTEVVTLSGCRSAGAAALPGAGLMGLTRAWLTAGSSNVVASLWETPDDTGELFLSFYRHLRRLGIADSLRAAQLEMLRSRTWRADPKYWAAYFILGRN